MREILFRGKTEDGKWVYGFYLGVVKFPNSIAKNCIVACELDYDYVLRTSAQKVYTVIPETVGQFTGLTDKNGTKIFEGDIVKSITLDTNTEQLAVVGFGKFIDENNDDEYLGFYIEFDGFRTTITQLEMEEVKNRFEVIGNIHDNSELLGEQYGK